MITAITADERARFVAYLEQWAAVSHGTAAQFHHMGWADLAQECECEAVALLMTANTLREMTA